MILSLRSCLEENSKDLCTSLMQIAFVLGSSIIRFNKISAKKWDLPEARPPFAALYLGFPLVPENNGLDQAGSAKEILPFSIA